MDNFAALQGLALKEVSAKDPSQGYLLRRICRWYSKEYHTPLHEVEYELDVTDVLVHYLEHHYEQMEAQDLHEAITKYLMPPEIIAEREEQDDAWVETLRREAKQKKAKQEQEGKKKTLPPRRPYLGPDGKRVFPPKDPILTLAQQPQPEEKTDLPPSIKMDFDENG